MQRVDVGGGGALIEPVVPGGGHHHHAVCDRCGTLTPFEDPGWNARSTGSPGGWATASRHTTC